MTSPVVNIYKEPNGHVVPFRDNLSFFFTIIYKARVVATTRGSVYSSVSAPPRIVGRPLLLLR